MSIMSVRQLFEGRSGRADFLLRRTYSHVYEVLTDTDNDDAVTAGTYPGSLPAMGVAHPEDPRAVVVNRSIEQDPETPRRWLVMIEYDTQPPQGVADALQPATDASGGTGGAQSAPGALAENPLNRPPRWRIGFQQVTEALRYAYKTDTAGANEGANIGGTVPVVNSAGDPFDPGIQVERSRPVVTITVNLAQIDLNEFEELHDAVNSEQWKGRAKYTARCLGVEAASNWENGVPFWEVTYQIALNRDGWFKRLVDAGYQERVRIGTNPDGTDLYEYRAFVDRDGNPVTVPQLLDGNGRKLGAGQPEVYKWFSVFPQLDFNAKIRGV